MIFVAVRIFSEILPIETDVQHTTNAAWRESIEKGVRYPDEPIVRLVCWLSANAKGGYREWVDISRREPSSDGYQRIIGHAGYRFRDPEEAIRFRELIG
jgi:hypothetical protein